MSYKELRGLSKQCGYTKKHEESLLKARPLAMGQLDRKRARDDAAEESSAAKKHPRIAASKAAFVVGKGVVRRHGQGWGSLTEDSGDALFGPRLTGWMRPSRPGGGSLVCAAARVANSRNGGI